MLSPRIRRCRAWPGCALSQCWSPGGAGVPELGGPSQARKKVLDLAVREGGAEKGGSTRGVYPPSRRGGSTIPVLQQFQYIR